MAGYLLDSHILLWTLNQDAQLSQEVAALLRSPHHVIMVSAVSLWELVVKETVGKLKLPSRLFQVLEPAFALLPLTARHARQVRDLPLLHRDPFDRMLVAQAQIEQLTLITHDRTLARYDVQVMVA